MAANEGTDPFDTLSTEEKQALAELAKAKASGAVSKRDFLKMAGLVGTGAAVGGGGAMSIADPASADASQTDSDGDIGTPNDRVDVFADGVNALTVDPQELSGTVQFVETSDSVSDIESRVSSGDVLYFAKGTHQFDDTTLNVPGNVEVVIPAGSTVELINCSQFQKAINFTGSGGVVRGGGRLLGNRSVHGQNVQAISPTSSGECHVYGVQIEDFYQGVVPVADKNVVRDVSLIDVNKGVAVITSGANINLICVSGVDALRSEVCAVDRTNQVDRVVVVDSESEGGAPQTFGVSINARATNNDRVDKVEIRNCDFRDATDDAIHVEGDNVGYLAVTDTEVRNAGAEGIVSSAKENHLHNVKSVDASREGILLWNGVDEAYLSDCQAIRAGRNGIDVLASEVIEVRGGIVYDNSQNTNGGFHNLNIRGAADILIDGVRSEERATGNGNNRSSILHLPGSGRVRVHNCQFVGSGQSRYGVQAPNGAQLEIYDSLITAAWDVGIELTDSTGWYISESDIGGDGVTTTGSSSGGYLIDCRNTGSTSFAGTPTTRSL